MDWLIGIVIVIMAFFAIFAFITLKTQKSAKLKSLWDDIRDEQDELRMGIEHWFLIQPCSRCHEYKMELLDLSPSGRSISYKCMHCAKKYNAAASSPKSSRVIDSWNALYDLVDEYNASAGPGNDIIVDLVFRAPAAPLPYEQTRRSPIPEAIRSEVWRRDGGCCVECDSRQNLQFDHIIPVAKGGATTVANLQLLCQPCNAAKGKRI